LLFYATRVVAVLFAASWRALPPSAGRAVPAALEWGVSRHAKLGAAQRRNRSALLESTPNPET